MNSPIKYVDNDSVFINLIYKQNYYFIFKFDISVNPNQHDL